MLTRWASNGRGWDTDHAVDAVDAMRVKAASALALCLSALPQASNDGSTALLAAAQNGHTNILKTILAAHAHPNPPHTKGLTPLTQARSCGNVHHVVRRA